MHTTRIQNSVHDRFVNLKGGREYAFTHIDPKRTAHLIVDMQRGFLEEGALLETPTARDIVPNVNKISQALREAGGLNLFLRFTSTTTDAWSCYYEKFQNPEFGKKEVEQFQTDSPWHDLYPSLDYDPGIDIVEDKTRFSAFVGDSSNALDILHEHGITTVIVSGTLTSCCCASTARDAQQLGFQVIMPSDANADVDDYDHNAAINNLAAWFADIRTAQEVVSLIQA